MHTGKHIVMQIATQLALFLDNRPGMLARVCDALSTAKINIYAITTSDTIDHSVIRMVVSDTRKALLLFEEHGTLVVESEVLLIDGGTPYAISSRPKNPPKRRIAVPRGSRWPEGPLERRFE